MPDIKFISWNIENLGFEKVSKSKGAVFNFIAKVVDIKEANMLGCMELPRTTKRGIGPKKVFSGILNALNSSEEDSKWTGEIVDAGKKEVYMLFWKTDQGFSLVENPGYYLDRNEYPKKGHNFGRVVHNKFANELSFPTNNGSSGGAPSVFYTFEYQETGNEKYFTCLLFHAPGPGGDYTSLGGYALSRAYQMHYIDLKPDGSNGIDLDNPETWKKAEQVIAGGDFNVDASIRNTKKRSLNLTLARGLDDLIESDQNEREPGTGNNNSRRRAKKVTENYKSKSLSDDTLCYGSLTTDLAGPELERLIDQEKTSLKKDAGSRENTAPLENPDDFEVYKANAYDHFFVKGMKSIRGAEVLPTLEWLEDGIMGDIVNMYKIQHDQIGFDPAKTRIDWEIQPQTWPANGQLTKRDAWLFYARLISDHLPIYIDVEL